MQLDIGVIACVACMRAYDRMLWQYLARAGGGLAQCNSRGRQRPSQHTTVLAYPTSSAVLLFCCLSRCPSKHWCSTRARSAAAAELGAAHLHRPEEDLHQLILHLLYMPGIVSSQMAMVECREGDPARQGETAKQQQTREKRAHTHARCTTERNPDCFSSHSSRLLTPAWKHKSLDGCVCAKVTPGAGIVRTHNAQSHSVICRDLPGRETRC